MHTTNKASVCSNNVPINTEVIEQTRTKRNRHFRRRTPQLEKNQVINLSAVSLTQDQLYVLSLGPKFCPTPSSVNELQLLEDTEEGTRRLRLREFFFDEFDNPAQLPTRPKFYKKSGWQPPKGRDQGLDAYCTSIRSMVESFVPQQPERRNLNRKCKEAIQQLGHMVKQRKIRIIPADKGGAVVVQDFSSYKAEALRQLENPAHYTPLSEDTTKAVAEKSNQYIDLLHQKSVIDDKCHKWGLLTIENTRTHVFYHLPKVHKDKQNPPGRPIVSGVGGPTEKLSKLVDHWLQPLVVKLPSYVKDTTHFLHIINDWKEKYEPLPENAFLVTVDVVGLYTNIPPQEVEKSLKEYMELQGDLVPNAPPTKLLLDIVNHVLQNNILKFDGQVFKQIFGTAMGTPMAPTIANLFMGWLEKHLLQQSPWRFDHDLWRRFIDDIAMLWFGGEQELVNFLAWLNEQHPTIKFTANYGSSVAYLDVTVSIVDGRLITDLHKKDTDASMILPFNSCHPRHCTRSIPYSQCIRIRRICSEDSAFHQRTQELKGVLVKRGYPATLVDTAIQKVTSIPRENTLNYKEKKTTGRTPFIVTHNPCNPPISAWLKQLLPVLHSSSKMKKASPQPPIVGERKCKNLRSILMPSALAPAPANTLEEEKNPGCIKCNKKCIICKEHLQETTTFSSVVTGKVHTIRSCVTCSSTNLVYLIDCARCRKQQYVGETGGTLQKRFYPHRSDIRNNKDTLVAKHFNSPDHGLKDMRVTIIELMRPGTRAEERKRRERFWRHKLKTNYPDGLNVFD